MLGGSEYWLAFAAATGMMLGSLYMSEIADFIPCQFCWYQRICAYPIVAIMFFAALRKDRNAWAATMTLALSGMALGLYHVGLEQGIVGGDGSCDPAAPCTINWLDSQGVPTVITIPRIAFCTFLFILGLGLHATARRPDPAPSTED
jgi:disulfide bond formation protein DsbB